MSSLGTRSRAQAVVLELDAASLPGTLTLPPHAGGVVAFAHGSGSSRHSPRNRAVAASLQAAGLGTLLFDLLSEEEDASGPSARFDIPRLADRLRQAVAWLARREDAGGLPLGLFGASTGAAAALQAAADDPGRVRAVVSRGGRPDLAMDRLPDVEAATLLIVGSRDRDVLQLNREALARLRCTKALEVVLGATHLFEEPGSLERVAALAVDWFRRHLRAAATDEPAPADRRAPQRGPARPATRTGGHGRRAGRELSAVTTARVRPLDHTGDVGFTLSAPDLPSLFDAARSALLGELMDAPPTADAAAREPAALHLEAPAGDRLLLRWLDELLYQVQTCRVVPAGAELRIAPPAVGGGSWRLEARLTAVPLDAERHGWRGEVKAVTYHGLELTRRRGGWQARVILDV